MAGCNSEALDVRAPGGDGSAVFSITQRLSVRRIDARHDGSCRRWLSWTAPSYGARTWMRSSAWCSCNVTRW